jgi:hypothetical protein
METTLRVLAWVGVIAGTAVSIALAVSLVFGP